MKYIYMLALLIALAGCAGGQGTIDYVNTTIVLPPLETAYPSDEIVSILEKEFSSDKMEWTDVELSTIAMHRNSILGTFWYLEKKREFTSDIPLYTAKDSLEQVQAHYGSLKGILSTRRIKMTQMTGIIYDATIRDSNRVLSSISNYLNATVQDLNSRSSSLDSKYLEMAWGYLSPLVGQFSSGLTK